MHLSQAYINVSSRLPTGDDIERRLQRAYDIVEGYGYEIEKEGITVYRVNKASTSLLDDTSASYTVSTIDGTCTCPDFDKARSGLCKHRLAIMMMLETLKEQ